MGNRPLRFDWDEAKNESNILRHGIDFADAYRMFAFHMMVDLDDREDYGETRYIGIGVLDELLATVVFTEPDEDTIRVISLRRATRYERQQYEAYLQDRLGQIADDERR